MAIIETMPEAAATGMVARIYADDDGDSQSLRDCGFSDVEIVDVALAAAARNFFSRALQALAVDADVPPDLSEEVRNALLAWPTTEVPLPLDSCHLIPAE